ncbi:MAG: MopE-related protein, partial [Bradymonadales bacterium]
MKKISPLLLVSVAFAFICFSACDYSTKNTSAITDFELREFGDVCLQHVECKSTYCIEYPQGSFCTHACELGCPEGWECKQFPDPHNEGMVVSLCALQKHQLCSPCESDAVCSIEGADWCIELAGGNYCAMDCSYTSCPMGYRCEDLVHEDGRQGRQCVPEAGTCECSDLTLHIVRGCNRSNEFGTCSGIETCQGTEMGWSECSAQNPQLEVCNGIDDDCNGFIDEGTDDEECELVNEYGTCKGVTLCKGEQGLLCEGVEAKAEICNGLDDNCDEQIDEGFVDAEGLYIQKEHCGACGQNCDTIIKHATHTSCIKDEGRMRCRADACEDGYFPYLNGSVCMALPSNLCMTCVQDDDCIGPKSECISIGAESFCGRDCSTDSPYGTACPDGYSCETTPKSGKQCIAVNKTCLCKKENLNTSRSCKVDTCSGFENCIVEAGEYKWSACVIDKYNVEICDGIDNNCDGRIDEGFVNPVTKLYDNIQHCGYCFNDCSTYYKPEIHHVEGACIVASGIPQCGMGACKTEIEQGIEYEWVDTDKIAENGCECRRVLGNTSNDMPDLVGEYGPGYSFLDENCDGIDGVIEDALFVRAGAASGNGTMEQPFGSINRALTAWPSSGKKYILVSEGVYVEDLVIPAGLQMHGGYSVNFKTRDIVLHASIIRGKEAAATMQITNVRARTLISGFVIEGAERAGALAQGHPSVAVWIRNSNSYVQLRSNQIVGGTGAKGSHGVHGEAGYGRAKSLELDGGRGRNSMRMPGPCPSGTTFPGGSSGRNSVCTSATSTPGGSSHCPSYNWSSNMGSQQEYTVSTRNRGLGGYDYSFDHLSMSSCSHATESGYPTKILSNVGDDGRRGSDGKSGAGGRGGGDGLGSIRNLYWVSSRSAARAGLSGENGIAGGGGGAG